MKIWRTHNSTWNGWEETLPLKDAKLARGVGRWSQGFASFDFPPLLGISVFFLQKKEELIKCRLLSTVTYYRQSMTLTITP